MRLLVVAGEASGDAIASEVVRALASDAAPALEVFGVAGERGRAAGIRALVEAEELAAMGLVEVLPRLPAVGSALRTLGREVLRSRPDAALLVDYHEANLLLGRWLRRRGVPVLLVVAPQTWAWRRRRAARLRDAVDHVACVLPFETVHLRALGVACSFVGHPAVARARPTVAEARRSLGIAAHERVLALLPGSRLGEVSRLATPFAGALRLLRTRDRVGVALVARAPTVAPAWLAPLVAEAARVLDSPDAAAVALAAADAALVCSGTATVEAALAGTPSVVAYRVAPATALVARALLRVRTVAMPNLLLARRALPELLQSSVTPEALSSAIEPLLVHGSLARAEQLAALARAAAKLRISESEAVSPAERIARLLHELAARKKTPERDRP